MGFLGRIEDIDGKLGHVCDVFQGLVCSTVFKLSRLVEDSMLHRLNAIIIYF